MICFCAPQFRFRFQLHGLFGLNLQMDDGPVRIHPDARDALASLDLNFTGFQLQGLRKGGGRDERIRPQPDAHPSQLEQLPVLAPGVRFREQQDNIPVLPCPRVQRHVSVANRHGVVLICAGGIPRHIIRRRELVFLRGQNHRPQHR